MTDFITLKTRLGRRRGFDGDVNRLGQFINDAIQEIVGARNQWSWLLRHHQFQTRPPDLTGSTAAGDVATVSEGLHRIDEVGGHEARATVTGALIALPDDNCYRIRSVHFQPGTTATRGNIWLEAPYQGASSATATWKIYYDEYALPSGASSLQSVVTTGNGYTYPLRQESQRPGYMHKLPTRDNEAVPVSYSVVQQSQIPRPPDHRWSKRASGGQLNLTAASGAGLPPGKYRYWFAYKNAWTGEVGPLSGSVEIEFTLSGYAVRVANIPIHSDYAVRVFRSTDGGTEPWFLADMDPAIAAVGVAHAAIDDEVADESGSLGYNLSTGEYVGRHEVTHGAYRLRFWPPVDASYLVDIQYYQSHPDLVADGDVPLVPSQYTNAILDFAEALALSEEENHSAAGQKRNIGMAKLERMISEEDEDPDTQLIIGGGDPASALTESGGRWPHRVGS